MHGGYIMCDKNDMDELFEFLGFQEALKIMQESKSDDTTLDTFHIGSDDNKTKKDNLSIFSSKTLWAFQSIQHS